MTIQGKIREGIASIFYKSVWDASGLTNDWTKAPLVIKEDYYKDANDVLSYLHSQGAELKVKCPDCEWSQFVGKESVGMTPCHTCNSTGYIYEPLVKEINDG